MKAAWITLFPPAVGMTYEAVAVGALVVVVDALHRISLIGPEGEAHTPPLADLAAELSGTIQTKYKDMAAQSNAAALSSYREGAYPLLRNTNYVLGSAGMTSVMRWAALAGGRQLGLTVPSKR